VPPTYRGDLDEALMNGRDVYQLAPGLVGIRGDVLGVFRFFEAAFVAIARTHHAEENRYPAMMPIGILEELDYFTHFPQQVTFCSHFPEDLPFLEAMVRGFKKHGRSLPAKYLRMLSPAAHVLKPAVCLPCYRQHRDVVLEADRVLAVTMQNHVFRYEGSNFRSSAGCGLHRAGRRLLRRHRAGRQREAQVMRQAAELCEALGLEARIELANDPFFLNESATSASTSAWAR
jgi:hypothetical protein